MAKKLTVFKKWDKRYMNSKIVKKPRLTTNLALKSKKNQPPIDKYSTATPKYTPIISHREPSYQKQYLLSQNQHSNSQKPISSSARGKRFSSIRRS